MVQWLRAALVQCTGALLSSNVVKSFFEKVSLDWQFYYDNFMKKIKTDGCSGSCMLRVNDNMRFWNRQTMKATRMDQPQNRAPASVESGQNYFQLKFAQNQRLRLMENPP